MEPFSDVLSGLMYYFVISGLIQVVVVLKVVLTNKKSLESVKDLVNEMSEGRVKEDHELAFLCAFAFLFGWLLCVVWVLKKLNLWDSNDK